ncbi:MAG: hypothetical protein A3F11_04085 [Gammaproteobacteria bacterium RIFCSPHIGHO2_12_FULL_37_14]|nr:MAG: hypothetical protein A3F11_04085 [Gammaproteobacteria bacterium RIFCSPHIGHO2_12_FULL_37_14]
MFQRPATTNHLDRNSLVIQLNKELSTADTEQNNKGNWVIEIIKQYLDAGKKDVLKSAFTVLRVSPRQDNIFAYACRTNSKVLRDLLIDEQLLSSTAYHHKNTFGQTPCHLAVLAGNHELVKWFLDHHQADVNNFDKSGEGNFGQGSANMLADACDRCDITMVRLLLQYGAIINPRVIEMASSQKIRSLHSNQTEIVKLLIEREPNMLNPKVNYQFNAPWSLLKAAQKAEYFNLELAQNEEVINLLEIFINFFATGPWAAIKKALVSQQSMEVCDLLMKLVATQQSDINLDLNAKDMLENSLLYYAVRSNNLYFVNFLIDSDVELDNINEQEQSALEVASMNGHTHLATLFFYKGTDARTTALAIRLAIAGGHQDTATAIGQAMHMQGIRSLTDDDVTNVSDQNSYSSRRRSF